MPSVLAAIEGNVIDAETRANSGGAKAGVKSAYRTVEILELLAERGERLSLSQVQREIDAPKSSLHGLLRTLVARGWLEADATGTSYGIGLRALRVGAAYLEGDPAVEAAGPLLAQLRDELDETVHLARLDGSDVVYLASRESLHHLRSSSRIGRRLPAHLCSLGKALLATRTDAEVDDLLPEDLMALTVDSVTTRAALFAELAEARLRGWAFEQGQNTVGLCCISVVVPGRGAARDALSCSLPLARLTDAHKRRIVVALAAGAGDLGRRTRHGG